MAKKFSPKFKAAALTLLDAGVSTREAQAQLRKRFRNHVGEGTLRKWRKEAEAGDAVPASSSRNVYAPDEETIADPVRVLMAPDADDLPAEIDTYDHVCKQLALSQRRADQAAADGNHTAAQRFSGDVVKYTLLKARLDKDRKSDTDAVMIPRAELERVRQAMRERVAALAADLERTGGLVCSHCGREIRIVLARGENRT